MMDIAPAEDSDDEDSEDETTNNSSAPKEKEGPNSASSIPVTESQESKKDQ